MNPTNIHDHAALIALLSEGVPQREAARRLGMSRAHAQHLSRRYREDYPGVRRPRTLSAMTGRPVVPIAIPAEIRAAGLSDDYRDLTRDFGPVEGARRCRRLLAETPAASSNEVA